MVRISRYPLTRHPGQGDPGVSGSRLDDRSAGADQAVGLGLLDHRQTDAVLHAGQGIACFQFRDQFAGQAFAETAQPHQRGTTDQVAQTVCNLFRHGGDSTAMLPVPSTR